MAGQQKFYTEEAAAYIGMKRSTLDGWRHQHVGPPYSKLGRRVVYDKADLDEYFASCSIETLDCNNPKHHNGGRQ